MPEHGNQAGVNELVREAVRRSEDTVASNLRRNPVLLLESADPVGRGDYVRDIRGQLKDRMPCVYADLASFTTSFGDTAVPRLIAELAYKMGSSDNPYGGLRFPRLRIAYVAMSVPVDVTDRTGAKRLMQGTLLRHRGVEEVKQILKDAAEFAMSPVSVAKFTIPSSAVGRLIDGLVTGLTLFSPLRRYILGAAQLWYGEWGSRGKRLRSKQLARLSIDVLLELSSWQRPPAPDPAEINSLLWKAFLADLVDNFRHRRRSYEWPFNAVVVLDNATSTTAATFLGELLQQGLPGKLDPLTIIVAGGSGLAAELDDDAETPLIPDAREVMASGSPMTSWVRCPLQALPSGRHAPRSNGRPSPSS